MSEAIIGGTIEVLSKALVRFATEDKTAIVRPSEMKIIIALSDITVEEPTERNPVKRKEGEPYYRLIKQDKPFLRPRKIKVHPGQAETDEVTFLGILDAKVDFFMAESQAKPYLTNALIRLADEYNGDMLNNEGFKEFVKSEQDKFDTTDKDEQTINAAIEKIKADIIAEHSVTPYDLEIWIVTPERSIVPGKGIDEPITPAPFLYAKGECIRQLKFAEDIFSMQQA